MRGHIPQASYFWVWSLTKAKMNQPHLLAELGEAEKALRTSGVSNESTVVFYGDRRNTQLATYGQWILDYLGHRESYILDGGFDSWLAASYPLQKGPLARTTGEFKAHPDENVRATLSYVRDHLGQDDVVLLDARTREEYVGEMTITPKPGRIPGSVHLPHDALLSADGRYRALEDLRSLAARAGAEASKESIVYCSTGERATLVAFALRDILGYPRVRVYPESFREWCSDPGLPIAMS
jgi:thiosulfate/3-mercaptopyruvate sulfurtransferase